MKLFKRKPKQLNLVDVAYVLAKLEPKRMERLFEIAKDIRVVQRNLDVFVNGRPDEIDKIEKELADD